MWRDPMTALQSPSTTESEAQTLLALQAQIQLLTDLQNHIQSLRHIPLRLLRAPSPSWLPTRDSASLPPASSTSFQLQDLKYIAETLKSETVQDALKTAKDCRESRDDIVAVGRGRRVIEKRRSPSPVSPKPHVPPHASPLSCLFPDLDILRDTRRPRPQDLTEFIRDFNTENADTPCRLHIYRKQEAQTKQGSSVILRFGIHNVMVVFLTVVCDLDDGDMEGILVPVSVTAFGPREHKQPHMHSDYTSFQILSQHISKMIESDPRVSLLILINLLKSYVGLFVDRCSTCGRVLSAESHVPPVARVWSWFSDKGEGTENGAPAKQFKLSSDNDNGQHIERHEAEERVDAEVGIGREGLWEPRHVTCLRV